MRESDLFRAYGIRDFAVPETKRCATPKCGSYVMEREGSLFCVECSEKMLHRIERMEKLDG